MSNKHNPSQDEMLLMLQDIHENECDVMTESVASLTAMMRSKMTPESGNTDGAIMNAIRDWRANNSWPFVGGDTDDLINEYFRCKSHIEVIELRIKVVRERISAHVALDGAVKSVYGTASMTKESVRVSYDAKMLDSLMATMIANGHIEYAEVLSHARKESTVQPTLVIKRAKE